jgi:hypothetical protein
LKQPRALSKKACNVSEQRAARFVSGEAYGLNTLRVDFPRHTRGLALTLTLVVCVVGSLLSARSSSAQQQTNPVDRKVENPITDTPSVNPLSQDQQPIRPRTRRQTGTAGE